MSSTESLNEYNPFKVTSGISDTSFDFDPIAFYFKHCQPDKGAPLATEIQPTIDAGRESVCAKINPDTYQSSNVSSSLSSFHKTRKEERIFVPPNSPASQVKSFSGSERESRTQTDTWIRTVAGSTRPFDINDSEELCSDKNWLEKKFNGKHKCSSTKNIAMLWPIEKPNYYHRIAKRFQKRGHFKTSPICQASIGKPTPNIQEFAGYKSPTTVKIPYRLKMNATHIIILQLLKQILTRIRTRLGWMLEWNPTSSQQSCIHFRSRKKSTCG